MAEAQFKIIYEKLPPGTGDLERLRQLAGASANMAPEILEIAELSRLLLQLRQRPHVYTTT